MEFVEKGVYDSTNILDTENNNENDNSVGGRVNINDPGLWPNITDKFRLFCVKSRSKHHHQDAFVKNVEDRSYSI